MTAKSETVALRLPPEGNAIAALQLMALLRAADAAGKTIAYSEAATALGLIDKPEDWSAATRSAMTSVCAVTAALGFKDQKLWARLVTKDGDVGQGFYSSVAIVKNWT
jgi:hypothetical protein